MEVNLAFCQMFGYVREELIGMHVSALAPVSSQSNIVEAMEAFKAGIGYHVVGDALRKDETIFICDARSTLFIYRGQRHILMVARDVTERVEAERELQEREEQYRSIFETTYDGLFIRNLDGFLVEANPAFCQLYGYSLDELIGMPASTLTASATQPVLTDAHSSPITYRGQPHVLGVVRDITEQVQAQQLLELRVEERTRELASLLEISHTVASTLQLNPLLGLILDQLKLVVDYTGASILTVEGGDLVILDRRSPIPEEHLIQLRFPLKGLRSIWKTIAARESIIIQDVREDSPLAHDFRIVIGALSEATLHYVRASMLIPLMLREQAIGMLVLTSNEEQAFTQHHASLALAVANQAAVAIENARLYAQAQALAAVEERQRLARELHDSVSQALYGISLGIHTARMQLDRSPKDLAESLDYVLELADAALIEMRALIFELRPESLESEGLVIALTKQAAALQARQGIVVKLDLGKEPELPLKVKQDLYRIAQEALHNIVKHAHASQVVLRMEESNNEVIMEIHDDGRGFDARASFPGHLGLHSMHERVTNLGGMFQIESTEGKGTTICIRILRQGAFQR